MIRLKWSAVRSRGSPELGLNEALTSLDLEAFLLLALILFHFCSLSAVYPKQICSA